MNFFTSIFKNRRLLIIIGILLCFFTFLISDRLIFSLFRGFVKNWYNSKFSHSIEKNLINSKPADIILLGTSRARYAVNPNLLEKLTKLNVRMQAGAGRNIRYSYHFYKLYRRIFPPPAIVIYGCDYFMFKARSRIDELLSLGIHEQDKNFMDPEKYVNNNSKILSNLSLLYRLKPQFDKFFADYNNYLNNQYASGRKREWEIEKRSLFGGRKIRKGLKFSYTKSPGIEGSYMIRLLDLLQKDGVRVIFVILPDYIGTYKSLLNKQDYNRDIASISEKYNNTSVYNMNSPGQFNLADPRLFFNGGLGKISSHLNFFGANILTIKLNRLINNDGN